jgi:hypothetical protein
MLSQKFEDSLGMKETMLVVSIDFKGAYDFFGG